ncbi:MAG: DUF2207 domain-containing protein [Oscillospiraceae bacterium]|jgi:hypothetical protein|nr:DUF2207 domain-containing protein [Oscillospiraceae bacterium]
MAKRYVDTKDLRRIKRISNIAYTVFAVVGLLVGIIITYATFSDYNFAPELRETREYRTLMALIIIMCMECVILFAFPAKAVVIAVLSGRKKAYSELAAYTSVHGIEYYRDFLKGISPADISILMDLQVEDDKDISATLLRLYDKKAVDFERGRIIRSDAGNATLTRGEQELLDMLRQGNGSLTAADKAIWKRNRIEDAVNAGLVEKDPKLEKRMPGKHYVSCCLTGCLSGFALPVVAGILGLLFFRLDFDKIKRFMTVEWGDLSREWYSNVEYLPDLIEAFQFAALFGLALMLCFTFPYLWAIRNISYYRIRMRNKLIRTAKGNELTEKVAGLKRFINEFSSLSQKRKEEVVLWNDFLVYAVVLEENNRIIRDISGMYGKSDAVDTVCRFGA